MSKLFFIGDSITAGAWDRQGGWASRLIGEVMDKTVQAGFKSGSFYCLPYNLGVSGDTVADILVRLEAEVLPRLDQGNFREHVQFVFSVGVNDSIYMVNEDRPRFEEAEFRHNLERLIEKSQKMAQNLSFIGLLPVDDDRVNPMPWASDQAYANNRVKRFEDIIGAVCQACNIRFLPLFDQWMGMADYKRYLLDGVHPNSEGHALMTAHIRDFILSEDFVRFHAEG